jgi:hypothetical protein
MQAADMSAWRQRRTGRWFLTHRPASLPHCRSTICSVPHRLLGATPSAALPTSFAAGTSFRALVGSSGPLVAAGCAAPKTPFPGTWPNFPSCKHRVIDYLDQLFREVGVEVSQRLPCSGAPACCAAAFHAAWRTATLPTWDCARVWSRLPLVATDRALPQAHEPAASPEILRRHQRVADHLDEFRSNVRFSILERLAGLRTDDRLSEFLPPTVRTSLSAQRPLVEPCFPSTQTHLALPDATVCAAGRHPVHISAWVIEIAPELVRKVWGSVSSRWARRRSADLGPPPGCCGKCACDLILVKVFPSDALGIERSPDRLCP